MIFRQIIIWKERSQKKKQYYGIDTTSQKWPVVFLCPKHDKGLKGAWPATPMQTEGNKRDTLKMERRMKHVEQKI